MVAGPEGIAIACPSVCLSVRLMLVDQ